MKQQLFDGYKIQAGGVFVTQLSGNAGIWVRRIVWVTTDCRLISYVS